MNTITEMGKMRIDQDKQICELRTGSNQEGAMVNPYEKLNIPNKSNHPN